ncbi:hypothetical protein RRG08_056578 [Elysia crispata]|uniref:Uncharacterized protein n=1 Tax=Elysia crispata TaxID=231223 RepID=A0AAE1DTB2_9GAST|nr:hypothetical protein RRG08_056578 [Elysia crispata]
MQLFMKEISYRMEFQGERDCDANPWRQEQSIFTRLEMMKTIYTQMERDKGFISLNLLPADVHSDFCGSVSSCCEIHTHYGYALFSTYGHLPLEYHMEFIDSSLVEFIQVEPSVGEPLELCWKKPRSKHDYKLRP